MTFACVYAIIMKCMSLRRWNFIRRFLSLATYNRCFFYFHQWKSILTRSRQWFSFKGNGALQFSLRICVSDENMSQQIQELLNWENNLFTVKYELFDGLLLTTVNSLVRWIVPSTQSQLKPRKQWKDCFVLDRNIFRGGKFVPPTVHCHCRTKRTWRTLQLSAKFWNVKSCY